MDDLGEQLSRVTAELEATLGEQKGRIDFVYDEDVTVTGDRIGYARLALELLNAAISPTGSDADMPAPDDRLLDSPIVEYIRTDGVAVDAAPARTSWKDRLLATGCFLFALFAVVAFFRGCAALERDIEHLLR